MTRDEFKAYASGRFLDAQNRSMPVAGFWLMHDHFVNGALLAFDHFKESHEETSSKPPGFYTEKTTVTTYPKSWEESEVLAEQAKAYEYLEKKLKKDGKGPEQ